MLLLQQLHSQECKLMQQQIGSYGQSTPQIKKWTFCQGRFSQGWLDNERSCPKMLGMLGGAARKQKAQEAEGRHP